MGLSGSGIDEENHILSGSWIAWLIDDSIGIILSVPFYPPTFCLRTAKTTDKHEYLFTYSYSWNISWKWQSSGNIVCKQRQSCFYLNRIFQLLLMQKFFNLSSLYLDMNYFSKSSCTQGICIHTCIFTGRFVLVRGGSCLQGFVRGFLSGRLCSGWFLSAPFCQNTSVTKLNITFNFIFYM